MFCSEFSQNNNEVSCLDSTVELKVVKKRIWFYVFCINTREEDVYVKLIVHHNLEDQRSILDMSFKMTDFLERQKLIFQSKRVYF